MFYDWNSRAVSKSEVVRHCSEYRQIWAFLSFRSVGIYSNNTQKFPLYIEISGGTVAISERKVSLYLIFFLYYHNASYIEYNCVG